MFFKKQYRNKLLGVLLLFMFSTTHLSFTSAKIAAQEVQPEETKGREHRSTNDYILSESHDYLRISGRQNRNSQEIWLHHPGSGIQFEAECEGDVTLEANIFFNADFPTLYFTVYIDGVRQGKQRGESMAIHNSGEKSYLIKIAENLPRGKHKFEIYRQNEAGTGQICLQSLQLTGQLSKQIVKHPRIEFIGDSITAGYGVYRDANLPITDTYYGDATRSYAFQTARNMNVDFNILAVSGYGLLAGWGKERNMVKLFPFTNWFQDKQESGLHPFAEQPVDIVCVNLGTNDWNTRGSTETDISVEPGLFHQGVLHFTQLIRQQYPKAKIVWLYGMILGVNPFDQQIISAIESLGGANSGIYYYQLPAGRSGLIGHPDIDEQTQAATALEDFLSKLLPVPSQPLLEEKPQQTNEAALSFDRKQKETTQQDLTMQDLSKEDKNINIKRARFIQLCSILVLLVLAVFALYKILTSGGK